MSKKNKAKFKRQIKNQVLQEMAQIKSEPVVNIKTADLNANIPMAKKNTAALGLEIQNLPQIKEDLRKTGIVVGTLALCILILAIFDQKYHILLNFGSWLFKVLNIQ